MALINPLTVQLFLKYALPAIPQVIQLVEQAFPKPKSGKKKKATVMKTVETLAKAAGLAEQMTAISKKVGKQIDDEVAKMNGGPG